ncbi:MAG TPA: amidohydrolase family protein, partial [Candidatus Binataceae bacterium]|nr:amidohydrolase family protein [Candidatus Binataceae bacterium]
MAMRKDPAIDVHAHTILPEVQALVSSQEGWKREAQERNRTVGADSLEYNRKQFEAIYKEKFFNQDARLADMDRMRIDVQTVSVTPSFGFNYWAERALAEQIIELTNAGIAAFCARRPARFVGLGNLAMQFPDLAATQLKRAIQHFHLKGVIVSTTVAGVDLAEERFEPVWAAAEELGALIFIHPVGCAIEQRLTPYYLSNVLGNPLETALALSHLIFSGLLDRHPRLRLLAAHGGGFLPFYSGRFDHGWRVRPEA